MCVCACVCVCVCVVQQQMRFYSWDYTKTLVFLDWQEGVLKIIGLVVQCLLWQWVFLAANTQTWELTLLQVKFKIWSLHNLQGWCVISPLMFWLKTQKYSCHFITRLFWAKIKPWSPKIVLFSFYQTISSFALFILHEFSFPPICLKF